MVFNIFYEMSVFSDRVQMKNKEGWPRAGVARLADDAIAARNAVPPRSELSGAYLNRVQCRATWQCAAPDT